MKYIKSNALTMTAHADEILTEPASLTMNPDEFLTEPEEVAAASAAALPARPSSSGRVEEDSCRLRERAPVRAESLQPHPRDSSGPQMPLERPWKITLVDPLLPTLLRTWMFQSPFDQMHQRTLKYSTCCTTPFAFHPFEGIRKKLSPPRYRERMSLSLCALVEARVSPTSCLPYLRDEVRNAKSLLWFRLSFL